EDLCLPYKPKRQTRAEIARKKGLEGLARWLMSQQQRPVEPEAERYISDEVGNAAEALKGARDIIAEWINEDSGARQIVRQIFAHEAMITSKVMKGKEQEGEKFSDYFDFTAPIARLPSHRLLAIRRGEKEGFLRVSISPDDEHCFRRLEKKLVKNN